MSKLSREFAADAVERFRMLAPGTRPAWGKLTAATVIPHLIGTMNYSLRKKTPLPFTGGWLTTRFVGPLIIGGLMPIPKNVKFKDIDGAELPPMSDEGDVLKLAQVMEEFIKRDMNNALTTPIHPLFGDIGPEGWSRLHVVHTKHHLKQFRL